ncbi:hypothetical protein COO60DRAFT_1644806 [Scenedesmus sp. NREL 46B-D3]|nr:hypothetical protein COO60DRAFT_1644806 [Scenedesmus sp. NREL 46B-D3]
MEGVGFGQQGLGFGQSAAATALGQQLQPSARDKESGSRGGGAGGKAGSVSVLDAAAHIPGYATMSAAERMKARMRLVMAKAEQQGTAAEAAEDGSAGAGAGAVVGEGGWTRFVFDKHGALDEDKLARQRLMDAEVAAGVSGSSAAVGASVEEAGAAFVMGTGRAAARRAATLITAQEQHEAAIFAENHFH